MSSRVARVHSKKWGVEDTMMKALMQCMQLLCVIVDMQ